MDGKSARGLGFWAVLALCVGNMIGSGIYLLPATLAPLGWNQMLGWLVTIAGALCLGLIFARLGAKLPLAGGPYAYANAAFGPLAGFVTAWSYWVMTWVGNGAVAVAVVSNLSLIFPVIGVTEGLPAMLALACIWLLTGINVLGVREAGQVQKVTTLLKLLLGLLRPTHGHARILGLDCTRDSQRVKERIGFTPDEPQFYDFLTGRETVDFVISARGLPANGARSMLMWPPPACGDGVR